MLTALLSTNAVAKYQVDIDAPRNLKTLLKKYLDVSRFAKREDITDEQFKFLVTATLHQARDLVETEGYFSPKIETEVTTHNNNSAFFNGVATRRRCEDRMNKNNTASGEQHRGSEIGKCASQKRVIVRVKPGVRTQVASIVLRFKGPLLTEAPGREQQVRKAWKLHPGEPFSQPDWDNAKNDALKELQADRYLGAKITYSQARIDPRTHQADLTVIFDSGPTFTLGAVKVTGLKRYPARIIHHVNPLKEGEIYRVERVLELQRQIQSTPYFASAAVDIRNNAEKPDNTPVKVKVNEYPYHSVRFGIGYASDTGARLQGHYAYNNLFGRAWIFDLQGQLEERQQYGALKLSMPPDHKAYTNSLSAAYTLTSVENTDIHSLSIGASRARSQQYDDYVYSILFHEDRLDQNAGSNTSHALVPSWTWTHRNVDDPLFPRQGNVFSLSMAFGAKGFLTEQSFARVYAMGRQYFPIGRNDIVFFRAEVGSVLTGGDSSGIPASLLFRAGGSNSVRGYSYQSIGNLVDGSVLPAKYIITGSGEYQHWFSRDWGAATFYDIGTVTDTLAQRILFQGIGIGVRWRSPVGPLNLDIAYGLRNRSIRPYLMLGVAF